MKTKRESLLDEVERQSKLRAFERLTEAERYVRDDDVVISDSIDRAVRMQRERYYTSRLWKGICIGLLIVGFCVLVGWAFIG